MKIIKVCKMMQYEMLNSPEQPTFAGTIISVT